MLAHPNIRLLLNTDYREIEKEVSFDRMIYTGQLDEFFDYAHGPLPYRSLRFESQTLDAEWGLDAATVNYPNEYDFTRVVEWKRLTGQKSPLTTLMTEYPEPHKVGENDPYYPIPGEQSASILARYQQDADKLKPSILFAGRLADYLNMTDIVVVPNRVTYFDAVILEGMALGKVIITNLRGGNRLLSEQSDGVICLESMTSASMRSVLERLASDQALCESLGAHNEALYSTNYTPECLAKRHLDLARTVLRQDDKPIH